MGYKGRYTQVKEAVRELKRVKREVFMPLIHRPGEAHVDFGYALAKVCGVRSSATPFARTMVRYGFGGHYAIFSGVAAFISSEGLNHAIARLRVISA